MVASMVSKWTGDRFTKGSIYDEHIKLNGYPYLSSEEEITHTTLAEDVMKPRGSDSPIQLLTQDSMFVGDIENLLFHSSFNGFPVVVSHESQYLVGFVSRYDLFWALDQAKRNDDGVVSTTEVFFTPHFPADSLPKAAHSSNRLYLRHILDLSPVTVTDKTPMETVLDFFRKLGLRQILITRNGRLLGIITKKDVLRHLLQVQNQHPDAMAFS